MDTVDSIREYLEQHNINPDIQGKEHHRMVFAGLPENVHFDLYTTSFSSVGWIRYWDECYKAQYDWLRYRGSIHAYSRQFDIFWCILHNDYLEELNESVRYLSLAKMVRAISKITAERRYAIENNADERILFSLNWLIDTSLIQLKSITENCHSIRQRLLSGMKLAEYYKTPEWKEKSHRCIEQHHFQCKKCGAARNLQAHHVTYVRYSKEWDSDLVCLCNFCHKKVHGREIPETPKEYL